MPIPVAADLGPLDVGAADLDGIGQALGWAAGQSLWSLSDDEVIGRVDAAMRLRAQADALLLAAVGEVDARDLARRRGASSIRAWLRDAHRCDPRGAGRLTVTARGLRSGLGATAEAMAAGAVSFDQARVIIRYVGDLAKEVPAPLVAQGEADMIGFCAQLDPVLLGVLGRRLAELVDPEGTQDRDEADALDREDKATAARTATLTTVRRQARTRTGSAIRDPRGSAVPTRWSRPASRGWPVGRCAPAAGSSPGSS